MTAGILVALGGATVLSLGDLLGGAVVLAGILLTVRSRAGRS